MGSRALLLPVLLVALASGPGGAAVGPALTVEAADVRFAPDGVARSRVSMEGDLLVGSGFADLDPAVDPLYVRIGSVVLLDGPASPDRARIRTGGGSWRLDLRGAPANPGRVTMRFFPMSGRFSLKARGLDASALRAEGPDGVTVEIVGAGEAYASTLDFEVKGDRRWSYRPAPPSPGPPGGGGEDRGGITPLAAGEYSGITTLRFEVVRDGSAWSALWSEHGGAGAPPAVDFSREMVVGLFLGARPTGGYSVDFLRMVVPYTLYVGGWCPPVTDPPIGAPCFGGDPVSGFLMDARETVPGPNCVVTTAVTYPFVLVKVPRVEGPGTYSYVLAARTCP